MENTTTPAPKYVAYYRVSTQKQGQSGLGLEAQRSQVLAFTRCPECVVASFTEIESGKRNDRPELAKAIARAKAENARLVVAKLDRLARNAAFIFQLKESGVDFVCADMPDANTLTIGIFASMAQHERELISGRTKAALAAKKAQGFKLGSPVPMAAQVRSMGTEAVKANAAAAKANIQARELVGLYRAQGLTYRAIAERLNAQGYTTRRGCQFEAITVQRLAK